MADPHLLLVRAYEFAMEKHKDQMYGDLPYIYHIDNVFDIVSERNSGDKNLASLLVVACLHDVMEDCGVSADEITFEFGEDISKAVVAISKIPGESYEDYMLRVLSNDLALQVKIADTLTNLSHSFLSGYKKGMEKYPRQLVILGGGNVKG